MTVASQIIVVPGDAPSVVPASRRVLYLDAAGVLCIAAPDGAIHKIRDPEENAYYVPPVLGFFDPTNGEPELPGAPDRYIASATANGWTAGRIYEFAPSLNHWREVVPVTGAVTTVDGIQHRYNGAAWKQYSYYAAAPAAYHRDVPWYAGDGQAPPPGGTLLARYTLVPPPIVEVSINGLGYRLASLPLDLSLATTWDNQSTDYTVASNRAGRDFYVYACALASGVRYVVSANSTQPTGNAQYSLTTTRKVGGFHCLCANVGTIAGHPLSGYLVGDILPASIWDLRHRPVCAPEGMVYVAGVGKWVDIYLASVSGGKLVSVNRGTIADGASAIAFHWYKASQWMGTIGKRMPTQHEFVALSLGTAQSVTVADATDPVTTGGHTSAAGRRMISNVGCEDACGAMWQWGIEAGGGAAEASWAAAYDGADVGVAGNSYLAPNRATFGGYWGSGTACGSRGSAWGNGPLALSAYIGARGVAEPLSVAP